MARERQAVGAPMDGVISIIGPGMTVLGDIDTVGTLRIEGRVEGAVRAGKAVVVGKEGALDGSIHTQDAVISGTVLGTLVAESRLEVQASARIEGDVHARRVQLADGAMVNGKLTMGDTAEMAENGPPAVRPGKAAVPRVAAS